VIAALYVQTGGVYFGLPNVDPWDEKRDARLYAGPWPVVAHPPCNRWSVMASVRGRRDGLDGGCFASALASVNQWGGVLEHPAHTLAWERFNLPEPPREGWQRVVWGGWVCHVEQGHYGHQAPKPTWLYFVGSGGPPALKWGASGAVGRVENLGGGDHKGGSDPRRSRTPIPFRDVLIYMAEGAAGRVAA
jgi:hypothetical protein